MEQIIFDILKKDKQIKEKISKFREKRFIFEEIYLERPFKALIGLRGVGKTTLLVQLALKYNGLYINLEDISLKDIDLISLITRINREFDFDFFLLDEVVSLSNWENKIKCLFELTNFNIVFSGSNVVDLFEKSIDLSRRVKIYEIPPLSFREFLLFKKGVKIKKIVFNDLLDEKKRSKKILEVVGFEEYLDEYMMYGAYPFSTNLIQTIDSFKNILNKIIYSDFVKIREVDEELLYQAISILKYISFSSDEVSVSSLANNLNISKTKVISILNMLERSQLIYKIEPKVLGKDLLRKHPKYLQFLPLRSLICRVYSSEVDIGKLREDFFLTSMYFFKEKFFYLRDRDLVPDFLVGEYVFEIGGKSKKRKQITKFKNSFLVKDSLENNEYTIPLILFGFLY